MSTFKRAATLTADLGTADRSTDEAAESKAARLAYEAGWIAAADASVAAGRIVTFDEISAWAKSIGTPDEQPAPRAK